MVELRKRKEAPPAPPPKPAKKEKKARDDAPAPTKAVAQPDEKPAEEVTEPAAKAKTGPPSVGDTIDLKGFGGDIETHDGEATTLEALITKSKAGVVVFTYPKASTPGCTKQVCFFRDSFAPLTATGLDIYGLSNDSPKANTNFKTKQNLPYPLLCDKGATLTGALGFKKGPSTQRGVFVVDKLGKVLALEPGSPQGTVDVVKGIVEKMGGQQEKAQVDDAAKEAVE